ncbi:carboxymuconolactone decarboxylase family protein [Paucibacter sp. Y2R2-4]|uniref:carboxymuconolactone decarboxylase family protein n=1 Tax=Paucibacter sp. Y2R2-4 TaxID=2893553 RepID=UPI0021E51019|nr:carboxymuconolactone decarboxylase family protein [Paucibacter sp. Y2R2-4]MCV2350701.1 carboxymuconolactone decarboxylase family protein [Paucibacter sp. Y2R2-4]
MSANVQTRLRLPYAELSSAALQGLREAKKALAQSAVGLSLIELLYLRVSQINGCAFCLEMHSKALRARGESQERLDALAGWKASARFSAAERAALRWAESLTDIATAQASDADFESMQAHFDAQAISDLTLAVATMNALNRVAIAMRH